MPRAKAKKNDSPAWRGFVDCNLDTAMKAQAKSWILQNVEDIWSKVSALVDDGYKVSFALDRYHDAYQASLSYQVNGHANSGLTLSGRGPDMQGALGMLLFKHYVVLDQDWSNGTQRAKDADPWG